MKIKYKYAFDQNNKIIVIDKIDELTRYNNYFCISCKNQLIPKIGKIRQKHFAHKHEKDTISCSWETYLHFIAKRKLYQEIQKRIIENKPLYLNYTNKIYCSKCYFEESKKSNCFVGYSNNKYNLLSFFNEVEIEKEYLGFRPDICLINNKNNDKIFLEIVVTHQSDKNKIQSNIKIIEILINNEEQLKFLENENINQNGLEVNFFNFKFKDINKEIKINECKEGDITKFVVFESGKSKILENISFYENYRIASQVIYEVYFDFYKDISFLYIQLVEDAFNNDIKIKNCHLCRYHGYKFNLGVITTSVFCKYYKKAIENSNEAVDCEIYRPDKTSFYENQKKRRITGRETQLH